MENIVIKALKVTQPIGNFYCGVIDAKTLSEITYSDVRRLSDDGSRELDDFIGIQRPLNETRVKKINKYVTSVDATFPNSIIISINEKSASWCEKTSEFTIAYETDDDKRHLAKILDGQHRIAGFDSANRVFLDEDDAKKNFELLVTIFVDADISTQANIFATVNLAQTKVNRSLVYDLESLAISRSPEKTAHDVAVLLNSKAGPFYKRIKRLGVATPNVENELLTQAAFVQNLLKLITHDEKSDRNYYLAKSKGGKLAAGATLEKVGIEDFNKYPFRKSFMKDKDSVIAANINHFFTAVETLWPNAWDKTNKRSALNKTIGFIALMRILRNILQEISKIEGVDEDRIITSDEYYEMLDGGALDENEFETIDPTSKTVKVIYDMVYENLALEL
ncbi:hypothetical protein PRUB_b1172 [Pseudoalteromonas rubra]|uniref:DGQHR domain-containing protein n=1 Tax=Pseudoalteromonas rubra TaxID=43658 RepID=A0A8T0C1E8_9GAMM|nr:DGQHR domain-containing protein [Pseudoalteromonas rubra]KAF7781832.1 hypothetical protein PRUB_b1172 [Pseudoalteromonas rubra]